MGRRKKIDKIKEVIVKKVLPERNTKLAEQILREALVDKNISSDDFRVILDMIGDVLKFKDPHQIQPFVINSYVKYLYFREKFDYYHPVWLNCKIPILKGKFKLAPNTPLKEIVNMYDDKDLRNEIHPTLFQKAALRYPYMVNWQLHLELLLKVLDEKRLRKYAMFIPDYVFPNIPKYIKLSKEFIYDYGDKLNPHLLILYQENLPHNFLRERLKDYLTHYKEVFTKHCVSGLLAESYAKFIDWGSVERIDPRILNELKKEYSKRKRRKKLY